MLFENWENVERVLLMGGAAYVALVIMLRLSGNRTLAKLSAFDLVVTVALGSTLATILLNRDVTLVEGVVAFLALIILQFVIAALSVRLPIVERFAKARPRRSDGTRRRIQDAVSKCHLPTRPSFCHRTVQDNRVLFRPSGTTAACGG